MLGKRGRSMSRIHLCLVSAQPIPNLIPLKMEEFRPDRVILVVSPDMRVQTEWLERVIGNWGIKTERQPIEPYDLTAARDVFLDILSVCEGEEMTLNVTGGTKIMAFAAFEAFRSLDREIVYVDTHDRRIQVLSPQPRTVDFQSVIKVKPYLESYGQSILADGTDKETILRHRPVLNSLARNMDKYGWAVTEMNRLTAGFRSARTFPLAVAMDLSRLSAEFRELLYLYEEHRIARLEEGGIVFDTLDDIMFVSGGWLEEHVFDMVSSLSPTDARKGLKVGWEHSGSSKTGNEYDVVFTMHNQLFLVECKTKRFSGGYDSREVEAALDPVYKLEHLKAKAGGFYGKAMFVSYGKTTDAQKRRLKLNGIEYCDGPGLRNLRDKLKAWVK